MIEIERITDRTVGISISGGADSAILAYHMLHQHLETTLHFFTYASQQKHFRTVSNSARVLEFCAQATGNLNFVHHTQYGAVQHRDLFFDFLHGAVRIGI